VTAEREPYVGPRPFEAAEADRFFGREREAAELRSLTISEPIVLFYSPSGAGKTSLLRTRLISELRERGLEVLPIARVVSAPGEDVPEGANTFVWNALTAFSDGASGSEIGAAITIPGYLAARPRPLDEEGEIPRRVLIFDQFEEIFTTGQWQDRRDFFAQLGQAVDGDPHLRVVLALREEYLARFDPYARRMPDRLRVRLRLDLLSKEQALLAVARPLEGTGRSFAPGVTEELVASLLKVRRWDDSGEEEGELVYPLHLQLVCARLWHRLSDGIVAIEHEHLKAEGDVDLVLASVYRDEVERIAGAMGLAEGTLRRFFEQALITPQGTRNLLFHGKEASAGVPEEAIQELLKSQLLTEEIKADAGWLEISHDRFLKPIQKANDDWWRKRPEALKLEDEAKDWERENRPEKKLLSGSELTDATRWSKKKEAAETGQSETLRLWLEASREKRRRKWRAQGAYLVLAFVALVLVWIGLRLAKGPTEARQLTVEARQLAADARQRVDREPVLALLLATEAVRLAERAGVARMPTSEEALRAAIGRFAGFVPGGPRDRAAEGVASADGRYLAFPVRGGGIDLLRLDERVLSTPVFLPGGAGASAELSTLAVFEPKGSGTRMIAAGDGAGRLSLWRVVPDGAIAGPWDLAIGGEPVERLAWSGDGRFLLDVPADNRPRLWRASGGEGEDALEMLCPRPLTTHSALDGQGRWLAAGCMDGSLRLWDLAVADPATAGYLVPGRGASISALAWSEEGLHLAAGDVEGATLRIEVGDPAGGAVPLSAARGAARAAIENLAWSADGHWLAAASEAGGVELWDLARNAAPGVALPFAATRVAFDPAGRWLLATRPNANERTGLGWLWPLGPFETSSQAVKVPADDLAAAAWSPSGSGLAFADHSGKVALWQPDANRLSSVRGRGTAPSALAFASGGWLRVETPGAPMILLRADRLESGAEPATIPADRLAAVPNEGLLRAQSADGRWLAELKDGRAELRRLGSPAEPERLRQVGGLSAVAFSPSSRWLATGDGAGNLRLWDLKQDRRDPWQVIGRGGRITAFAWSPNERYLAAARADGTANLWAFQGGLPDGQPHKLDGHAMVVTALAWNAEGRWLATGSFDQIRLWNLAEGLPEGSIALQGHVGAIRALAFEPDGRHLLSAGADGRTLSWRMDLGELLDLACRLAGRNLNDDEWRQFVRPIVPGASNRKTCPEP
jgi:WD40 repeat protein